tara:strand:- start:3185 stop:3418 length:234 start_codon:yes stop_codon:yes gene_type:complete
VEVTGSNPVSSTYKALNDNSLRLVKLATFGTISEFEWNLKSLSNIELFRLLSVWGKAYCFFNFAHCFSACFATAVAV